MLSVRSWSFRVFECLGCFLCCFGCFKVLRVVSGFYSVLSQGFLNILQFFVLKNVFSGFQVFFFCFEGFYVLFSSFPVYYFWFGSFRCFFFVFQFLFLKCFLKHWGVLGGAFKFVFGFSSLPMIYRLFFCFLRCFQLCFVLTVSLRLFSSVLLCFSVFSFLMVYQSYEFFQ